MFVTTNVYESFAHVREPVRTSAERALLTMLSDAPCGNDFGLVVRHSGPDSVESRRWPGL